MFVNNLQEVPEISRRRRGAGEQVGPTLPALPADIAARAISEALSRLSNNGDSVDASVMAIQEEILAQGTPVGFAPISKSTIYRWLHENRVPGWQAIHDGNRRTPFHFQRERIASDDFTSLVEGVSARIRGIIDENSRLKAELEEVRRDRDRLRQALRPLEALAS